MAVALAIGCNKRTYPTISARNPDGGNVSVRGTYNHCPQTYFAASPDHARVGQPIALAATASDVDGDVLTYSWMASSGTIDDAHAATTTFHCTTRGSIVISLTVSDSSCDSPASGEVLCASEDAGTPDAAIGGAGGAIGIGGHGGNATGQPGTAGSIGASGGTTGGAGSTTTGSAGAIGAGGVTATGGTGAGSGGTGAGSTGTGGTACVETGPPAAIASACAACVAANANPATDGCCMLHDASGLQLCQAAAACMRAGGPPVGTCIMGGDPTSCFCGTNLATCDQTGKANGPCVSQMSAAAARNVTTMMSDSPTAAQVLSRQGDPSYALGRAANISAIAAIFCPTECGIEQ